MRGLSWLFRKKDKPIEFVAPYSPAELKSKLVKLAPESASIIREYIELEKDFDITGEFIHRFYGKVRVLPYKRKGEPVAKYFVYTVRSSIKLDVIDKESPKERLEDAFKQIMLFDDNVLEEYLFFDVEGEKIVLDNIEKFVGDFSYFYSILLLMKEHFNIMSFAFKFDKVKELKKESFKGELTRYKFEVFFRYIFLAKGRSKTSIEKERKDDRIEIEIVEEDNNE